MSDSILISGGTGFLGTALSAELLKMCDAAIYVLVRASSDAEASHRLREAWQHDGALYATIGGRVRPVVGDFTKPGLGLDAETADRLIQRVKYVFHVGAEVGFQKGEAELMAVNRVGGPDLMALPTTRADYETALRAAQADTYKAGYLPYSIVDGWQQLAKDFAYWRVDSVAAKAEKDPKRKAWYVADLRRREELIRVNLGVWAHFIGDASQPLHLTIHYNGWGEGPNPEGFTTDRRTHSRFEDAFVGRFVTADMVRAKMTPYQACSQPVDACTARYLQTTWKTVVPFYQLEKAGGFKDGDPRGQAFAAERLAAGASALRDFVVDAWNASAKGTLGYPPVSVEDMVAGKVDPWDALYGVN